MATKKKMLEAAAGGAGGASLDITDVFSTYLWDGINSSQSIVNGVDLSGEGGLTWIKLRNLNDGHHLFDTERGSGKYLVSNETGNENTSSVELTSFNSDGFTYGNYANGYDVASWTFRKAPKFFDVVTYTGTGSAKTIAHSLGSAPGMIIVKSYSASGVWGVYHRSLGNTKKITLNETTAAETFSTYWNNTDPTSTEFTVGTNTSVNTNGNTYVAYLFAHNDSGDGEFGPDGDQDIIKCGSYTGTGATGTEVNLGWEPQYVLIKNTTSGSTENWGIFDTMRGMPVGSADNILYANTSNAEATTLQRISLTATGFILTGNAGMSNQSGHTYIYMAIRRGPLAPPEAGTEAFAIDASPNSSFPVYEAGFPVDFGIRRYNYPASGNSFFAADRLRGANRLITNLSNAEASTTDVAFDSQVGWWTQPENSTSISYMWKRAPSYFDVVAYTGNSTAGRAVSHNVLGVAPEMIWLKNRNGASGGARPWIVYHKDTGNTGYLKLNEGSALITSDPQSKFGNGTVGVSPTASDFTVASDYEVNYSGDTYIAYLFATLAGVSKVGSYVGLGAGNPLTIDCGFTSGARFVLIKKTDAATGSAPDGSWFIFDSVRGITASTDPYLQLNTTSAEASNFSISPHSSGFTVIQDGPTELNQTGKNYIFYAIA